MVYAEAMAVEGSIYKERARASSKTWRTKVAGASTPQSQMPEARENESTLVDRLKLGDHAAFETLFNRHSGKVFHTSFKILGETAEAEEVVQDVFWTIYDKAKSFRGTAQFSTWIYRLTVNSALGRLRRKKRSREILYDDYLPQFQKDGHHQERPVVDWSEDLDQAHSKQELQELLKQALDELKPVDKAVVILSDVEGLADKEIAETLRLTTSAVKTRLHRSRLVLRGRLAVHLGHSPK